MKAAELFVKCLETEGVEYVFGLPGEENDDLVMALEKSSIKFILTRHEQGAAFMANAYGRLTGKAGVCMGTLGPGATNLVTGVADGNMDRAPIVVITGQADIRRQHKESHQAINVVAMYKPITKWAWSIIHPDNIPEVVHKAFKLAEAEKPGACHIELPEDIAAADALTKPIPSTRVRRAVPADKIVDQAMELIRRAKRPLIMAGNGAIRKRASRQLKKFVDATGMHVVSTFMGKGAVSYKDPKSLYTIGLQARDAVFAAQSSADLIITLGYDLVEYHPALWNQQEKRKIIHIDFHPAEVDKHYVVDVEIVGDLAHTLWMMNERVKADPVRFDVESFDAAREVMRAEIEEHKDDDGKGLIRPQKILWDTREVMGPDDILLSDVGAHKMWVARYYHCETPNTCLIPNGFCSMGFALPAAIGAKLIHPDKCILALCGDAGFLMNVQDLETAKRLGTNIVVMIWEDREYGLITWKQQNRYGRHADLSFDNPDFVQLAESFGCRGIRVENARDFKPALEDAFTSDVPCLLIIPIDYRENMLLSGRLGNIACPI
jgi:acetolactate synthase-1/2/3 large subunit